jgi:streptogramin lyase
MWKQILSWCTPRGVWLIGALAFVMGAGVATPLVAQAATVDVWNLGAVTEDIRVGPSDEVWTMTGDKPTRLDPATNEVTTYTHPLDGRDVVAVDGSGMAWSSEYATAVGYLISRLDPATLEVRSWPVGAGGYATSMAVDATGDVWFGRGTTALWRLHPATDTVAEWTLPISGVNVWSFDSTGRAWLSYSGGVAVLDPVASNLTYWAAPAGAWQAPVPDASGNVWFAVTYP